VTTRAIAALQPGSDQRPRGRPFSVVDELNCYFDSPAEPNNVQLEVWLPGHLGPERLRAAVATVLADVPAVRARRAAGTRWRVGYAWELPPVTDADPVSVTSWRTEAELGAARTCFLAAAPELDRSPPFLLLLAQGPSWDSLILNAHHAAFDGRSCVRLLSLIAAHYGGGRPREAPAATGAGTPAVTGTMPPAVTGTVGPAATGAETPAATGAVAPSPRSNGARRPSTTGGPRAARGSRPGARRGTGWNTARIAPRHASGRAARGEPGYGLSLLEWPGVPTVPRSPGDSRVTVNDLLIAALIETITRWNTGRRRRPGRVQISMPVDTRPPGYAGELGNLSRLCTITVDPSRVGDLTVAVADQTRRAKSAPGPPVGPVQAAVARTRLPAGIKRGLLRLALRSVGAIRCDTSLLSNLGNVTEPPAFGPLTPTRMWFSTSAHMPRGLSVGAVTVGGRLNLCFRYRNALLDAASGRDFAAGYAAALSALAAGGTGR
jgi:NRPS condensation-like uncharacterized protein